MRTTHPYNYYSKAFIFSLKDNKVIVKRPKGEQGWKEVLSNIFTVSPTDITLISQYSQKLVKGLLFNNTYSLYCQTVTLSSKASATYFTSYFNREDKIVLGWCANTTKEQLVTDYFKHWYNKVVLDDESINFPTVDYDYIKTI